MKQGVIICSVGGFYDVKTNGEIIRCRLRGKFRQAKQQRILVGDWVEVQPLGNGEGVVESILPRQTELVRPQIANVDQVVVVSSIAKPEPNLMLIDRLLVLAEAANLRAILCINKAELDWESARELASYYQEIGYLTLMTSVKQNMGIQELISALDEHITAFAGLSGVGKSSLLNTISPGLKLQVGEVSAKLKRGKHTTRMVQLLPLPSGGLVADTPGFSQLELGEMPQDSLKEYFPDFRELAPECKYNGCLHKKEPGCAVKAAVEADTVAEQRYRHYLSFLAEIESQKRY